MIQILPPECYFIAQPLEIDIGKRAVCSVEVAHGTLQNRARTDMVASGLVMKRDRQLNHTLEVPAQGAVLRRLTPSVFKDLMGVEEAGGVEEGEAAYEVVFMHLC